MDIHFKNSRLTSLDLAKGAIMIIMALDHASAMPGRLHWSEFWGTALPAYDHSLLLFFTRYVTHLCAPGFFLFMGVGVVLLAVRQEQTGMPAAQIRRHFVVRGLVLLLAQQLLENPAWALGMMTRTDLMSRGSTAYPADGSALYIHFSVLATLAISLIIGGLLYALTARVLATLGVLLILLSVWMTPDNTTFLFGYPLWQRILFVPGLTQHVNVLYALVPWLGVTLLGMSLGKQISTNRQKALTISAWSGLGALVLFALIRLSPLGDSVRASGEGLIRILAITKYPPSIEFLLMTLGANLLLLALWERLSKLELSETLLKPVTVFGQTALFFYLAHLYIYALIANIIPSNLTIGQIYLTWLAGLIPMYFLCLGWLRFKRSRSASSLWRLF